MINLLDRCHGCFYGDIVGDATVDNRYNFNLG